MPLRGIVQIVLYVADMQAQVEFYRDVFGFDVIYPITDEFTQEHWVELNTGTIGLALHSGGRKLFVTEEPCIVFETDDIEETHMRLSEQRVKLEPIFTPVPDVRIAYGWDPEGNRLALRQVIATSSDSGQD